jgi:nickel/cobalt transporter (NicO) family protein
MSMTIARLARFLIWPALVIVLTLTAAPHVALAQFGGLGGPRPVAIGGFAGWILAEQAMFYRSLAGMIRLAKSDGSALWGLMGISFLYGIFHAAGPGHGKAVISSYLVANEETWRRGIILSLASAVMQSLTAITIVGVAAILLGATAKFMGDTVRVIEIVSYVLIVLLGARLLWVKGRSFLIALHTAVGGHQELAPDAEAAHSHVGCAMGLPHASIHLQHAHEVANGCGHAHSHDEEPDVLPWGHAHGPEPYELAGPGGWRRGWSAIIAVGLRPCSGAIIVLVFSLAQGLFWAGIGSTFVMGLGTAITVASIATLTVGARGLAKRLLGSRSGYGTVFMRGAEVAAALLVVAFGVLLLTGYMASEQLVGF